MAKRETRRKLERRYGLNGDDKLRKPSGGGPRRNCAYGDNAEALANGGQGEREGGGWKLAGMYNTPNVYYKRRREACVCVCRGEGG